MQLREQELIDINQKITEYLPKEVWQGINIFQGTDFSHEITVRQLLAHNSGIADYYTGKPNKKQAMFDLFLANPLKKWTVEETVNWTKEKLKANDKPGNSLLYSDTNYQLLGMIIENITQKELYQVYQDYIFIPLNLQNTYLLNYPALADKKPVADIYHQTQKVSEIRYNGSYWADGGIVSTTHDCLSFLTALKSGKLINQESLNSMHQWQKIFFPFQYGLGTMKFQLPKFINYFAEIPDLWGHSGSVGSFLFYSEDLDLYIAGTINQSASSMKPFMLIGDILWQIKRVRELE